MLIPLLAILCFTGFVLHYIKRRKKLIGDEQALLEVPSVRAAIREKLTLQALASKQSLPDANKIDSRRKTFRANNDQEERKLPRGQYPAKKWIVLDLGLRPSFAVYDPWLDPARFRLRFRSTSKDTSVSLHELYALGAKRYRVDWHCVTGWSFRGLELVGVPLSRVLAHVAPDEDWRCLFQVSADGYTAPIMRDDVEACLHSPDLEPFLAVALIDTESNAALLGAHEVDVATLSLTDLELLPMEHGGPRIVVPSLYGWKSAKFLTEIHFLRAYHAGFWEKLGCNQRGRHEFNERWSQESARVWNVLSWATSQYLNWGGYAVWIFVMQKGGNALGFIADKLFARRRPFSSLKTAADGISTCGIDQFHIFKLEIDGVKASQRLQIECAANLHTVAVADRYYVVPKISATSSSEGCGLSGEFVNGLVYTLFPAAFRQAFGVPLNYKSILQSYFGSQEISLSQTLLCAPAADLTAEVVPMTDAIALLAADPTSMDDPVTAAHAINDELDVMSVLGSPSTDTSPLLKVLETNGIITAARVVVATQICSLRSKVFEKSKSHQGTRCWSCKKKSQLHLADI